MQKNVKSAFRFLFTNMMSLFLSVLMLVGFTIHNAEVAAGNITTKPVTVTNTAMGLPEYSVNYSTHIQNIGWQDYKTDYQMSGTENQGLRLEAIKIKILILQKQRILEFSIQRIFRISVGRIS